MAAFCAYFDDSGTHDDSTALVVSGYVASVENWTRFSREWNQVLRLPQFDLEYVHMRELRAGRNRFAKFKDNLPLQADLFNQLQSTTQRHAEETFACGLVLSDWESVNREFLLEEKVGTPFTYACGVCIGNLGQWMHQNHYRDDLQIVIDQGTSGWGAMSNRMLAEYGARPLPGNAKTTPPLQASDLTAWEHQRMINQCIDAEFAPSSVTFRGSLNALMSRFTGTQWKLGDGETLRTMCEMNGVPRRTRHS